MEIASHKVASIHYVLKDHQGNVLQDSSSAEPVSFLVGAANIVWGLERALLGHKAGDQVAVTVPPGEAYGERDPAALKRVPAKHIGNIKKIRVGHRIMFRTPQGNMQGTVLKVGRFHVDVDMNHPLAGQTLNFDVNVVDVRDASNEEIQHGHPHGPEGCGH